MTWEQAQVAGPVGAQVLPGVAWRPRSTSSAAAARADYLCRRRDRRVGTSSSLSAMVREHIASVIAAPVGTTIGRDA
jgi:hypothetical protein